jgi:hypothetical protein
VKLFRKAKSKFYWYDFTVRGCRYRGSTQETRTDRASKVTGLKLARVRIRPSHVRPLEAIAMDTGKGEIFKFSLATMLSCNDVIDLEGRRVKS